MGKVLNVLASDKPVINKRKPDKREGKEFLIGDTKEPVQKIVIKERKKYIA